MPRAVLLLSLLLMHAAAQAQAPVLEMLVYPNAGVFESAPGQSAGGPGGAMLQRLQTLSGVKLNQQLMPIPRALLTVKQKPGHCMVAVSRTPEREATLLWVGPWARGATAIFVRGDDPRRVHDPLEVRGGSIVVLRDSAPSDWLKSQSIPATEVKDNTTGLRMLQARRVDFWLANDLAAHFVIRADGGPAPRQVYNFGRIDLYMGCHTSTDPAAVAALDAGIAQMRRNGELTEFGMR
ncbi:transporter substrate-binding domain-containing protein [Roseateles asaccharophilus]|uniref:ABC-type amino acid transport substrate-binding protein n=1 Tax=Roseateles asaccharophilus TaxID=582607 RepID=A0ABU2A774_9BURK|nr:transporter substrate-binding domain-containing protein [Roseateles asaccharophilus]MDR7331863.1 ABC-type amino acid transport substrate-binding protein [Roseateles asaccharophilus]